jgi:hypothetical protein
MQLLVHRPRDVGQNARPIHTCPLAPASDRCCSLQKLHRHTGEVSRGDGALAALSGSKPKAPGFAGGYLLPRKLS